MFLIKKFRDEADMDSFKTNLSARTRYYSLKPFQSFGVGLYARIGKNFITMINVTKDDPSTRGWRGGKTLSMRFYGCFLSFFGKWYLFGIFLPTLWYTALMLYFWANDPYDYGTAYLLMWIIVYLCQIKKISQFYQLFYDYDDTDDDG